MCKQKYYVATGSWLQNKDFNSFLSLKHSVTNCGLSQTEN